MRELSEEYLLEAIARGIASTSSLIAKLTDYHGGPVETEYLITGDIARELVERGLDVKVEHLNWRLFNALTKLKGSEPRKDLGKRRTDIAVVLDKLIPLAIIEIKIRISSLSGLKEDLDKITKTMALMNGTSAARVIGASVFQIHVPGSRHRVYPEHFKAEALRVESTIDRQLAAYESSKPGFTLKIHSLQSEDGGIVGRDVDLINGEYAWGAEGHATRYHAILIRSTRPKDSSPSELLAARLRSQQKAR